MYHTDFCIIGGGVIGNAIARELSRFQYNIILLEKANDITMGCTKANSGILHGGYDSPHGTLKSQCELKGNAMYDQWNEELEFGLRRCGSYVIAFSEEEIHTLHTLKKNGELNGVQGLEIISPEELFEHEPLVNKKARAALSCHHSGVISPYEVAIALAENAAHNGVEYLLDAEVRAISALESHHTSQEKYRWMLETSHHQIKTSHIINCAGVHSDEIAALAGITDYHITPRRGAYYIFRRGYMPVSRVLFQAPTKKGKGVLVSPTYHGNLLIGPDALPISDKDDTTPTQEQLAYISDTAAITIPSLDMSRIIRTYAGVRPTSRTKDFIIKRDRPGLINLVGIESPGLTSAPAIAEYVLQLLRHEEDCNFVAQSQFDPSRKKIIPCQATRTFIPLKEGNALSKLPSGDPQRIVCRCEQVNEGTIQDALSRVPHAQSTDAVKRRTRAGMGICQGKFCKPLVKELLAEKWNITIDSIAEI